MHIESYGVLVSDCKSAYDVDLLAVHKMSVGFVRFSVHCYQASRHTLMANCVCVYVFQELTRPETKAVKAQFAQTVAGKPTLRKCARNFIRYCDEDRSSKISLAEWSECLKLPGKAMCVDGFEYGHRFTFCFTR